MSSLQSSNTSHPLFFAHVVLCDAKRHPTRHLAAVSPNVSLDFRVNEPLLNVVDQYPAPGLFLIQRLVRELGLGLERKSSVCKSC
jgi:hypothetical protein